MNVFCTVGVDIYSVGWDEIDEMDVKVVRKRAEDRLDLIRVELLSTFFQK